MLIPALTLWQPWASLIFTKDKRHETRSQSCPAKHVGKRIAIHAAARPIRDLPMGIDLLCRQNWGSSYADTLPRGMIIGTAVVFASRRTEDDEPLGVVDRMCGDWSPGRFAWHLTMVEQFAEPIPWKGRQGWFRIEIDLPPDEVTVPLSAIMPDQPMLDLPV